MLCIYMSTLSHAVNYRADLVGRVYCSLDSGIARCGSKRPGFLPVLRLWLTSCMGDLRS